VTLFAFETFNTRWKHKHTDEFPFTATCIKWGQMFCDLLYERQEDEIIQKITIDFKKTKYTDSFKTISAYFLYF